MASPSRARILEGLRFIALANLLVLLQIFICGLLFAFPFIVFIVAVKFMELTGAVLWPGGF